MGKGPKGFRALTSSNGRPQQARFSRISYLSSGERGSFEDVTGLKIAVAGKHGPQIDKLATSKRVSGIPIWQTAQKASELWQAQLDNLNKHAFPNPPASTFTDEHGINRSRPIDIHVARGTRPCIGEVATSKHARRHHGTSLRFQNFSTYVGRHLRFPKSSPFGSQRRSSRNLKNRHRLREGFYSAEEYGGLPPKLPWSAN